MQEFDPRRPTLRYAPRLMVGLGGICALALGWKLTAAEATAPTPPPMDAAAIVALQHAAFAQAAAQAGIDGLIIVDCPPEEADPLADALDAADISLIRLATPTTDDRRLPPVLKRTSGFVYYVSVTGVTGAKEADAEAVRPAVERIRAASGLPVAVGFGIKTPERAGAIAQVADAAVVGSALVDEVADALAANEDVTGRVLSKVGALAKAVRSARNASVTA